MRPTLQRRISGSCAAILVAAVAFCLIVHKVSADAPPTYADDVLRASYEARVAQTQEMVHLLQWGATAVVAALGVAVGVLYRSLTQAHSERVAEVAADLKVQRAETERVSAALANATSALDRMADAMSRAPCLVAERKEK